MKAGSAAEPGAPQATGPACAQPCAGERAAHALQGSHRTLGTGECVSRHSELYVSGAPARSRFAIRHGETALCTVPVVLEVPPADIGQMGGTADGMGKKSARQKTKQSAVRFGTKDSALG